MIPRGLHLVAQAAGSFWMPPQSSTSAAGVDRVFYFIYGVAVFFFVLIVALMLVFVVRYRQRAGRVAEKTATHSTALEITWTVIPLIIVITIFVMGFRSFMDLTVAPGGGHEIQVYAKKWNWSFRYPNGYVDSDLHVPVNTPVRLVMSSSDVIHSFFVPAFRQKMDVIPGRYTKTWFQATQPGTYDIFCAEYCGTGHSNMTAHVVVHPPGEYEKWLENASNWVKTMPPAEAGKILVAGRADGTGGRGCNQCHKVDGTRLIGPPLNGIWGKEHVMSGGAKVRVDENYIRESILDPQARVLAGYESVAMPTYKGLLNDEEIEAIIAYIKTLQ